MTNDSLLARQRILSFSKAVNDGFNPTKPTKAFTTIWALLNLINSSNPSSPNKNVIPVYFFWYLFIAF